MRSSRLALLIFCSLLCGAHHERLGQRCPVKIDFERYFVEGQTPEELRQAMLRSGPKDEQGTARFAYTAWSVKWRWPKPRTGIDVRRTQIVCSAKITLPELRSPERVAPDVRARWEAFVARVRTHELRHVEHMAVGAPLILRRLELAAARGRLDHVRANEVAHAELNKIRAKDRRYDRETNHGETEGAWSL